MERFATAGIDVRAATSPAELAAACRGPHRRADAEAVITGLVALAPDDPVAALTALVALGPVLNRLAARSHPAARRDGVARAEVLAIAWEVVVSPLPGLTPRRVVAAVWNRWRTDLRRSYARCAIEGVLDETTEHEAPGADPAECVSTLLHDALRRGVVTRRQAALVHETRIVGRPATEIARSTGRSPAAVWKERDRAETALRRFVQMAPDDASATDR